MAVERRRLEEFSYECESLKGEVATAELERYRALDKERQKWEAQEERLLHAQAAAGAVADCNGEEPEHR